MLRSALWRPGTWTPNAAPSRTVIAKDLEVNEQTREPLEIHYRPHYADRIHS